VLLPPPRFLSARHKHVIPKWPRREWGRRLPHALGWEAPTAAVSPTRDWQ